MPKNKTAAIKKSSQKKAIIEKIKPLIKAALQGIEKKSGQKKFEKSVNKAAKLLSTKLKSHDVDKRVENVKNEKEHIITNPLTESIIVKPSKKQKAEKIKNKKTTQKVASEKSEEV